MRSPAKPEYNTDPRRTTGDNMISTADPFFHHPELRDKIVDPLTSFFRNFRAADVLAQRPELGEAFGMLHSDADDAHFREVIFFQNFHFRKSALAEFVQNLLGA